MVQFDHEGKSGAHGKVRVYSDTGNHNDHYLRLFVAGNTIRASNAILNLRGLLERYIPGHYHLEVIDIFQQPDLARKEQIIATPTLVKYEPAPKRIFVGDFTRTDVILSRLGLKGHSA